eukprot:357950-Chlamydomonas_euryale.AAC.2
MVAFWRKAAPSVTAAAHAPNACHATSPSPHLKAVQGSTRKQPFQRALTSYVRKAAPRVAAAVHAPRACHATPPENSCRGNNAPATLGRRLPWLPSPGLLTARAIRLEYGRQAAASQTDGARSHPTGSMLRAHAQSAQRQHRASTSSPPSQHVSIESAPSQYQVSMEYAQRPRRDSAASAPNQRGWLLCPSAQCRSAHTHSAALPLPT